MTLPDAVALAAMPVHVIVRDFPETLVVFTRLGVELPRCGAESLAAASGAEAARAYEALRDATAWRASARPGPCTRAAAHAAAHRASAFAAEVGGGIAAPPT